MKKENQIAQLRSTTRVALQNCNPKATPNFCKMLTSAEGYAKAEDMVVRYAMKNRVSVGAAIGQLESILS